MRKWWNWQTRKFQVLVSIRAGSNPAFRTILAPSTATRVIFLSHRVTVS